MTDRWVMIENRVKHVPSFEYLSTLGLSGSRGNDESIGQFGTGFIKTLALFARIHLHDSNGNIREDYPTLLHTTKVCLGSEVITFFLKAVKVKDSRGRESTSFQIWAKRQGGAQINLNIDRSLGELDWGDVTMGAREIVSNACDGAEAFDGTYGSVVKNTNVDKKSVRASDSRREGNYIRVFFMLTPELDDYFASLNDAFLCLRPSYDAKRKVFINQTDGPAVVYRKGVRGFTSKKSRSLFHYNLPDIKVDESRNIDSDTARTEAAKAIMRSADPDIMERFLREVVKEDNKDVFESEFNAFYFDPGNYWGGNVEKMREAWTEANRRVFGGAVLCENDTTEKMVKHKGHLPVKVASAYLNTVKASGGVKKADDVLNWHEINGLDLLPPTENMVERFNFLWRTLDDIGMLCGKSKPILMQYHQNMRGEGAMDGYYAGHVCVRSDQAEDRGVGLMHTLVHEVAHHVTGAADYTPDFQEWAFKAFAALLCKTM